MPLRRLSLQVCQGLRLGLLDDHLNAPLRLLPDRSDRGVPSGEAVARPYRGVVAASNL
jgi:hypothetical protein